MSSVAKARVTTAHPKAHAPPGPLTRVNFDANYRSPQADGENRNPAVGIGFVGLAGRNDNAVFHPLTGTLTTRSGVIGWATPPSNATRPAFSTLGTASYTSRSDQLLLAGSFNQLGDRAMASGKGAQEECFLMRESLVRTFRHGHVRSPVDQLPSQRAHDELLSLSSAQTLLRYQLRSIVEHSTPARATGVPRWRTVRTGSCNRAPTVTTNTTEARNVRPVDSSTTPSLSYVSTRLTDECSNIGRWDAASRGPVEDRHGGRSMSGSRGADANESGRASQSLVPTTRKRFRSALCSRCRPSLWTIRCGPAMPRRWTRLKGQFPPASAQSPVR